MPDDQSSAITARAGAGTSTTAAPRTTTTSPQPPPANALTAHRNHAPCAASTLGFPNRDPAPAASTTPATERASDMRPLSTRPMLPPGAPRRARHDDPRRRGLDDSWTGRFREPVGAGEIPIAGWRLFVAALGTTGAGRRTVPRRGRAAGPRRPRAG